MERKQVQYKSIRGMNKDLSISKFNPDFIYDGLNIRVNSMNESSLFTITNEKGNSPISAINLSTGSSIPEIIELQGDILGYCVVNKYIIIFTKKYNIDRIYSIFGNNINSLSYRLLYEGNLNFVDLIETIGVYESDEVVKVYWVDNYNQPRVINVSEERLKDKEITNPPTYYHDNEFDFWPELNLEEDISIEKQYTGGQFHSGVIQYAFTYWNRNSRETNIFYTTDIYDISFDDRAGSPEEICNCSFKITIDNIDQRFDYLRIYSIMRTSLNGTPVVRIVSDFDIRNKSSISFTDNGIIGSLYDSTALRMVGGDDLIIGTISTKDNVLFGGNVRLSRPSLEKYDFSDLINHEWSKDSIKIQDSPYDNNVYIYKPYTLKDSNNKLRIWKKNERYRFGFQLQYKTGVWSEIKYIDTFKIPEGFYNKLDRAALSNQTLYTNIIYNLLTFKLVNSNVWTQAKEDGYKKIRIVYVPLESNDRSIVAQGFLTNTLGSVGNRINNSPFSMTDYYTRPNLQFLPEMYQPDTYFQWVPFRSLRYKSFDMLNSVNAENIGENEHTYNEMLLMNPMSGSMGYANMLDLMVYQEDENKNDDYTKYPINWFIDSNIVNFWSPDVEFGDVSKSLTESIDAVLFRGSANSTGSYNELMIKNSGYEPNGWSEATGTSGLAYNNISSNAFLNYKYNYGSYPENMNFFTWDWMWEDKTKPKALKVNNRYEFFGFNDMFVNDFQLLCNKVKFIDTIDSSNEIQGSEYDAASGRLIYNSKVNEIRSKSSQGNIESAPIIYDSNKHIAFSFDGNWCLPMYSEDDSAVADVYLYESVSNHLPLGSSNPTGKNSTPYYRQGKTNSQFVSYKINIPNHLGDGYTYDYMTNRPFVDGDTSTHLGYPYIWIVDLTRSISEDVQYGGNTEEAILKNKWIPCSGSVDIDNMSVNADRGDTFVQRYDCMRVYSPISDLTLEPQQHYECISVLLESFINLDGRYDDRRYSTNIKYYNNTYNQINTVHSQKDNFWEYIMTNYDLLYNDNLPTTFLYSEVKNYDEPIDSYTKFNLTRSYTADGECGQINYIDTYKNELYGFQDNGIFNILYNQRVQIPSSDNVPIEISSSSKLQGIRYITKKNGCKNKWSVNQSQNSLFFIDDNTNDIFVLNDPLISISDDMGMKTWCKEYVDGRRFITSVDLSSDDVYFSTIQNSDRKNDVLVLSNRLKQFETRASYDKSRFMFNFNSDFIGTEYTDNNNTFLWLNHGGNYNQFYGYYKPSSITFRINPDMPLDKVFDNLQYRMDLFQRNIDNGWEYMENKTFNLFNVYNEYQNGQLILQDPLESYFKAPLKKKFRIWSTPFPRENNSLNRIRNPFIDIKLTLDQGREYKMHFHDAIISYTI